MEPKPLDHDNRNERAYPNGRQPWSYTAIIRYARQRNLPYRIKDGFLEIAHNYDWDSGKHIFTPYRGLHGKRHQNLNKR